MHRVLLGYDELEVDKAYISRSLFKKTSNLQFLVSIADLS